MPPSCDYSIVKPRCHRRVISLPCLVSTFQQDRTDKIIHSARRLLGALSFPRLGSFLASCGSSHLDDANRDENIKYAGTIVGDGGAPIARVATSFASCPSIVIDGVVASMTLRAAATTPAQRTMASAAADSKPSVFPLNVCEATLPTSAQQAIVGMRSLPLPNVGIIARLG